MQAIVSLLVAFGPFALTVMASAMAIWPPRPRGWAHWVWLAAIVAVGLPISWATYTNSNSSDRTNSDTNGVVHGLQTDLANQRSDFDRRYRSLDSKYGALSDNFGKVVARLHLNPADPIGRILKKLDALSPHTFTVKAGSVFLVPTISGEVSVRTLPNRPTTIRLPAVPYSGEEITVKDADGHAGEGGMIKVDGNGKLIDGQAIYYLPFSRQSDTYKFDGTSWGST